MVVFDELGIGTSMAVLVSLLVGGSGASVYDAPGTVRFELVCGFLDRRAISDAILGCEVFERWARYCGCDDDMREAAAVSQSALLESSRC